MNNPLAMSHHMINVMTLKISYVIGCISCMKYSGLPFVHGPLLHDIGYNTVVPCPPKKKIQLKLTVSPKNRKQIRLKTLMR